VDEDTFRGIVEFKGNNPLYIRLMSDENSYFDKDIEQVTFKEKKDDIYNILRLKN
jgi:hypothetical protein